MKRHTQVSGIRKWSGDDLLELQSEPFKVLDGFLSQYGDTIISGCEVTDDSVAAGLVCIDGLVMPFDGVSGVTSFPIYLTKSETYKQREYVDNIVKNIAVSYSATVSTTKPESGGCITITASENTRFTDFYKEYVNEKIGDIDTVLDSIISTQETI